MDSRRKARPHVEGSFKRPSCVKQKGRESFRGGKVGGRSISTFPCFASTGKLWHYPGPQATAPTGSNPWPKSLSIPFDDPSLPIPSYLILCSMDTARDCTQYIHATLLTGQGCLLERSGPVSAVSAPCNGSRAKEPPMRVEHLQPPRAGTVRSVQSDCPAEHLFAPAFELHPSVGSKSGSSPFSIRTVRGRKST